MANLTSDRMGQQLGNYRIIRLLGEGGFAEVYLGEHIYLKTPAAIKVLHTQLSQDDQDSQEYQCEANRNSKATTFWPVDLCR